MISAVAILMLCNGIRISLKSKKYNQRNRVCHGVHDTPFSFLHFFSSDFTDESEGILAYRITHGISRNFGRWPMARARYMLLLFFVTQISQMTQIFLCEDYFVPQISQIYTDFSLWGLFRPTDFTDIHRFFFVGIILSHRFHRYTQIFLCGDYFVPQISQIYTDFSLWDFFQPQGVSAPTGQVASAKIRV